MLHITGGWRAMSGSSQMQQTTLVIERDVTSGGPIIAPSSGCTL